MKKKYDLLWLWVSLWSVKAKVNIASLEAVSLVVIWVLDHCMFIKTNININKMYVNV